MSHPAQYHFGFDIGGTFTDFVLCNVATGQIETYKTLTTPSAPAQAVIEGWNTLLERVGARGSDVALCIHGTTLITNALIERKGSQTALVTTSGFSDILDTQREMRYDIYDLHSPPVAPLVPRSLRAEVDERLDAFGAIVTPLAPVALDELATFLTMNGVQAVAVCLLHAYRNPVHEQAVGAWLRARFPQVSVSLSSEVAPEIREYERMSTTVANAYVQPLTSRYLDALQTQLTERGYGRELYLMLSSGGITVAETAARFPIRLVESGPAAGALAAVFYGQLTDQSSLVSFDMGGTTAKICVITNGKPLMTNTFEIARMHRFKRGSGLPVRIPAIELIEIGAGGGSIAHVDELGLLKVGPHSAGADPGPASYGRGGTLPTVTDANLLLGYLNANYFLGGRLTLDVAAAEQAVQPLADALDLTLAETAYGIHRVVNESMIAATRVHVAERGVDPRRMVLLAFGGAGPLHAAAIARALKMRGFMIPTGAGVASAVGFLTAPTAFDLARTSALELTNEALEQFDRLFEELVQEGRATLERAGVAPASMRFVRRADMRHVGQGHEIAVDLPEGTPSEVGIEQIREAFFAAYEVVYGYAHRHLGVEIMTCRLTASGGTPTLELDRADESTPNAHSALKGHRPIYLAMARDFVRAPVYERTALQAGMRFVGPALVEESDSTTLVGPGATVTVDAFRNLLVLFDES
ncbi:MAG: hydantoinase/oxoprolinase family protein [Chloroflexales bacterium]|nr:hydantoinase/oxoprolinase family protein [Chloroflexales bacterium]